MAMNAADLPAGSIVANEVWAFIKRADEKWHPGWNSDEEIDQFLSHGGYVLRVGDDYGREAEEFKPLPANVNGYPMGHHRFCLTDALMEPS